MQSIKTRFFCVVVTTVLGFLLLSTGCGSSLPDGMPKLYPCSVNITMNDEVLADAVVYFYPTEDAKQEYYATGCTDASGNTEMKTILKYSGVAEGTYKVAVIKTIVDPDWKPTPDMPPEQAGDAISPFDFRYSVKEETPFECEIKPEKNQFSFNIEQKGKPKQATLPKY